MLLSYIIVCHNSSKFLPMCIQSIKEKTQFTDYELIIIDNSINDDGKITKEICDSFSQLNIKHKTIRNKGYGNANNEGAKMAEGDILAFVNPDVRLKSKIVETLLVKFHSSHKNGLLAFRQRGYRNLSFYLKPEYFIPYLDKVLIIILNKLKIYLSKYFFTSGAFFFMPKKVFFEIGSFDEKLFMYFEEPDMNNRLRKLGYKIVYNKNYVYDHLIGDRKSPDPKLTIIATESLDYYCWKYNVSHQTRRLYKKFYLSLHNE